MIPAELDDLDRCEGRQMTENAYLAGCDNLMRLHTERRIIDATVAELVAARQAERARRLATRYALLVALCAVLAVILASQGN